MRVGSRAFTSGRPIGRGHHAGQSAPPTPPPPLGVIFQDSFDSHADWTTDKQLVGSPISRSFPYTCPLHVPCLRAPPSGWTYFETSPSHRPARGSVIVDGGILSAAAGRGGGKGIAASYEIEHSTTPQTYPWVGDIWDVGCRMGLHLTRADLPDENAGYPELYIQWWMKFPSFGNGFVWSHTSSLQKLIRISAYPYPVTHWSSPALNGYGGSYVPGNVPCFILDSQGWNLAGWPFIRFMVNSYRFSPYFGDIRLTPYPSPPYPPNTYPTFEDEAAVKSALYGTGPVVDTPDVYAKAARTPMDDDWHTYQVYVCMNTFDPITDIGLADGIVKYWIDGDLKFRRSNCQWKQAGSLAHGTVTNWNTITLLDNASLSNQAQNGTQLVSIVGDDLHSTCYVDDFVVSTAPIDRYYVIP